MADCRAAVNSSVSRRLEQRVGVREDIFVGRLRDSGVAFNKASSWSLCSGYTHLGVQSVRNVVWGLGRVSTDQASSWSERLSSFYGATFR